jgi:hypothetical protein
LAAFGEKLGRDQPGDAKLLKDSRKIGNKGVRDRKRCAISQTERDLGSDMNGNGAAGRIANVQIAFLDCGGVRLVHEPSRQGVHGRARVHEQPGRAIRDRYTQERARETSLRKPDVVGDWQPYIRPGRLGQRTDNRRHHEHQS